VLISTYVPTVVQVGTVNAYNSGMNAVRAVVTACAPTAHTSYAVLPCATSFQGGLRFESGEKIGGYGLSSSAYMTITGYEL
jgi:hypothetical protein